MIPGSRLGESEGFRWRRWYAPLVVVVALAADYLSPAEMWTAFLPLAFMAVLLTFRERAAALVVLFLSSWIFVTSAAAVSATIDAARGKRHLYGVQFDVPGLEPGEFGKCYAGEFPVTSLLDDVNPRSPVVPIVQGFATYYNQMTVWYVHRGAACESHLIDAL
jgi:hypothetical protein